MNKKIALKLTGLVLIVLIVGISLGYAAAPSAIQTIGGGIGAGAPEYTIYRIGSDYYAKDQNGANEYSGTVAATVIQAAIDDCETYGEGLILFSGATFVITTGLTVDGSNIRLRGEGRGTTILDFSTAEAGSLFTLGNSVDRRDLIEISFMTLKGRNSDSYIQTAINVNYCRHCRFYDLEIYYFQGTGGYAIEGRMAHCYIVNCHFWTNKNNVLINGESYNTANHITNNYFFLSASSTGYHLDIQGGSTLNQIIGNIFEGSVNRIRLNASNNVFTGNTFEWVNNAAVYDMVVIDDNNVIKGNFFTNHVSLVAGNEVDGFMRGIVPIDLSGAAVDRYYHFPSISYITNIYFVYSEASSADAGITLKIGKESDDDYFYTGTSEVSKAQYYTATLTLLKHTVAKGDTLIFNSAGGKVGTGEILLVVEWVSGGWTSI